MKTIAEFKRQAKTGATFRVVNHKYPELGGIREVLVAQTQRLCLSLPVGHPRWKTNPEEAERGSWLNIPKRSEVVFNEDGSLTIQYEGREPFCTITILEEGF